MSFLISLLLFLGVINSEAEFDESNATQYEQQYATQENIDAYCRQNGTEDDILF